MNRKRRVYVEELGSQLEPMTVMRALLAAPYPILFDSAGGLPGLSRYTYVTADPFMVLRADEAGPLLEHRRSAGAAGLLLERGGYVERLSGDPFRRLSELLARHAVQQRADLPPFQGGAAGYLSYELGGALERLPGRAARDLGWPDLTVGFYDWVVAFDRRLGRAWLIVPDLPGTTAAAARRRAAWLYERLARATAEPARNQWGTASEDGPTSRRLDMAAHNGLAHGRRATADYDLEGERAATLRGSTLDEPAYLDAVRRVKEYIAAGDVYQVNLSQRLHVWHGYEPWELYMRLRRSSPAPFGAYLGLGMDRAILSASPELFLRLDGRSVESRPIKGTRPRGSGDADAALYSELRASEKDRAENLMIVDLIRNDLGRVCRPGTVRVPELFAIEEHPTVWQQVSRVTGELEHGATAIDLLRACFPGGSVTGAPKIRAMEIIDELEPAARGVYCGAIGYISFGGHMVTSIPIRTIVVDGEAAYVNVGGGIVADSDPAAEYAETLAKARGALRALGIPDHTPDGDPLPAIVPTSFPLSRA